MSVNTWIVVGDQPTVGNLVAVARSLGGPVGAVVAGPRSVADTVARSGVDKVVWCSAPDDVPVEANASAVADAVAADPPRVVLGRPQPRATGCCSAPSPPGSRRPCCTGARSVAADGDDVVVLNAVFGGIAEETVAVSGPVALLLDGRPVPSADGAAAPIEEVAARAAGPDGDRDPDARLRRGRPRRRPSGRRHRPRPEGQGGPRPGRGARPAPSAPRSPAPARWPRAWTGSARTATSAVPARTSPPSCTSPSASPASCSTWSGCRGAETIVAINTDPNAPVFAEADYGVVGDLYQLVPALTAALKRRCPMTRGPAELDFDVIVIGAGVAGCVTAYLLAQQGHSVVLIERGEAPGSKNLSGGVLYSPRLRAGLPGLPRPRRRSSGGSPATTSTSSTPTARSAIDYRDARLADPVNAVTVLRAKLDAWLAEKCEEAGVFVMPGVRVDRVLTEGDRTGRRRPGRRRRAARARGGRRRRGELLHRPGRRPAQEGAAATTSPSASRRWSRCPAKTIEERFDLTGDEGAACRRRRGLHRGRRRWRVPVHQHRLDLDRRRAAPGRPDREEEGRRPRSSTTSSSTGSSPPTSRAASCSSTAATWSPRAAWTWWARSSRTAWSSSATPPGSRSTPA